jgi:hypothetical protein
MPTERGEDGLQDFGRDERQQHDTDQDAGEKPDGPGAEIRQVQVAERKLLARRGDRARQHQRDRGPDRHVHQHRMRHAE